MNKLFITYFILFFSNVVFYAQDNESVKLSNHLIGQMSNKTTEKNLQKFVGFFDFMSHKFVDSTYHLHAYQGELNQTSKNGTWHYTYQKYRPNENSVLKNNLLQTTIDGKKCHINGRFKNNLAEGHWELKKYDIKNSDEFINKMLHADFKNGLFINKISQKKSNFNFEGQFDNQHFFEGHWQLNYNYDNSEIIEHRFYSQGLLTEHYFETGNQKIQIAYAHDHSDQFVYETAEISEDILNFLRFNISNQSNENLNLKKIIEFSDQMICQSFEEFYKLDQFNIWHIANVTPSFKLPKIRFKKYIYTTADKEKLYKLNNIIEKVNQNISNFLKNESIIIHRNTNEDIAQSTAILETYQEWIESVTPIMWLIKSTKFDFIHKDFLVDLLFSSTKFKKNITNTFKDIDVNFNHDYPLIEKSISLSSYVDLISKYEKDVNDQISNSEKILSQTMKLAELKDKEAYLLKQRELALSYLNKEKLKRDDSTLDLFENLVENLYQNYLNASIEDKRLKID